MTKILNILTALESTASRLEKEAIIASHKEDPIFQLVLRAAMDPQITFYLSKLPKVSTVENNSLEDLTIEEAVTQAIDVLAGRKITGNAARAWYDQTSESLSVDDRVVFERVIKKDLRCGVKESTVNTAFGYEFIYTHPNLLCSPYSDKDVEKLFKKSKKVYCQLKSDGARCQIVILEDRVMAYTRKGNLLDFRGRLDHLLSHTDLHGWVLDGELLTRQNGVVDDRATCNGIVNKLIQGTISDEELDRIFMTTWDIFPWENMKTKTPYKVRYEDRFENLTGIVEKFSASYGISSFFDISETHVVSSLEEAMNICDNWMANGIEGGIIKSADLEWADKRDKNSLKVKAEETGEFIVVDYEYGEEGKQFEGFLGGLIVETSCGKLRTKIGKGFSTPDRLTWLGYNDPEALKGLIVECGFNSITESKNKETYALFLEKFIKIRLDKTEANTYEELV